MTVLSSEPGSLRQAVELAGLRGRVVVAGVVLQEDSIAPLVAFSKEISIRYSQAYTEWDFAAVIDAIAAGKLIPDRFTPLRSASTNCPKRSRRCAGQLANARS